MFAFAFLVAENVTQAERERDTEPITFSLARSNMSRTSITIYVYFRLQELDISFRTDEVIIHDHEFSRLPSN